ncbi:MAG: type 1 glutamine amidotransferase [Patescibacteria group bacterium]|nr:type 1 glutamine amidotransferase [Patescibacteria group bacterium]
MSAPTNRREVKLLLVQARHDQAMKIHEITCFETSGGLSDSQVKAHDLVEEPVLMSKLEGVHGIIIGGSGDYSVLDDVPNIASLEAVVREARQRGLPILGCSWGHQMLAKIFGGQVVHDLEHREVGTIEAWCTADATYDPLFSQMPERFLAQAGHKDRVSELPSGAVRLAASERCPTQAFTFPGTGIYGVQFHPELGREDLAMRLMYYKQAYVADVDSTDHLIGSLKDTPEAAMLVGRWVDVAIVGR